MADSSDTAIQRAARENIEELEEELEELREELPSLDPMELDAEERDLLMEYERKAVSKQQLEKIVEDGLP